jgi:predicted transcriptional regulator
MTNVKALEFVLTNCADLPSEVTEKLTAMKTSFEKKSSTERKPTPTQQENMGHKQEILNLLADGGQYTITDIMKGVPALSELSNQRVSAIVRQLTLSGEVVRVEDKRKAYFKLAD